MEDQEVLPDNISVALVRGVRAEEDEEDFQSCCEDDEVWKDNEEVAKEEEKKELDEFSVKMFFKGISLAETGDSSFGFSGIGVVMERSANSPVIQVQKKLDFYVEESVADYLALMDGLTEAMQNKILRVYAFTDSTLLHDQITCEENLDNPLLMALRERIMEHSRNLEEFVLKLVPSTDLLRPLQLAQVAIGVVSSPAKGDKSLQYCSICFEDKPSLMMITMKCSHRFCSHCMRTHVDGKLQSSKVPIRCPQSQCKYYISTAECRSFLPLASYESLERAQAEANVLHSDGIYCPYPNCSVLLDPRECLSTRASSSSQSDNSCVECPVCQRFICVECGVPWHSSMSCEMYQNLPLEERDAADITLHRLAQNKRWRRCQQCRRMIELAQGCYHMTCWCGHEFCYSCGAEYRDSQQTCQCAFWEEDNSEGLATHSVQESEQWAWETFNSLPMIMDAYSDQERSQLALIQRFLAGGFSLSDHHPYQSPPRCTDSYVDAMKDLRQLPWLERFVSVISDNYYEDYIQ
ncbi:putative E3 ubiquitin-protein ligase [Gossypium arboreum]|uniref:RBR-type E3 ubiquitin transferase n=2 Tax=Gossypium arboreum TaxID=29729 RepID=A0A0B0MZP3_GOSAR|nr:E3 ubiquitin-protein ligase RSL1 [Gossypium arboreum]XP_017607009.1 E3 ubiquitin-protein ligase RSL1 [Gossypium arboreum]XP_017607010.1 E3 ubiquitin-protein ligase RSL1 [Gossypium arboreum]XP_017607011.1 E3 ubiquitin-protein ligase RSL1 [Gossypium arboreum]XP_017607012.1 E3 ubiquitin-protein ligase RSL1 [Gossypium arboreum]XP_052883974.1 E3 ubiquitin-protein ligase RSL1 [Gossypium arboreum]XP_052883975.1 E3 ubiquitin-protein ligase RSL1 [Gossypium arboreum]XP_052883976.1 E3 ubiquitin-prot